MIQVETRPFEARFGARCPLCNKSWGDPSPCGDSRADWTIQKALGSLFADRRAKDCAICGKGIPVQYTYCYDCGQARERARRKGDRHARLTGTCAWDGKPFEYRSDKKHQRYCSLSCSNSDRHSRNRGA